MYTTESSVLSPKGDELGGSNVMASPTFPFGIRGIVKYARIYSVFYTTLNGSPYLNITIKYIVHQDRISKKSNKCGTFFLFKMVHRRMLCFFQQIRRKIKRNKKTLFTLKYIFASQLYTTTNRCTFSCYLSLIFFVLSGSCLLQSMPLCFVANVLVTPTSLRCVQFFQRNRAATDCPTQYLRFQFGSSAQ